MLSINSDKMNASERLNFLEYLAQSLANGFSLNQALELAPYLFQKQKQRLSEAVEQVANGALLGELFLLLGFNYSTARQVNLAMEHGDLTRCLQQLARLNRIKNAQFKKLKAELSYPLILVGMMILLLIFMQSFITTNFAQSGEKSGDYLLIGLLAMFSAGALIIAYLIYLAKRQDAASLVKIMKVPVIGPVMKLYAQYLLTYEVSLLLQSGFSIAQICQLGLKASTASLQYQIAKQFNDRLMQGQSLHKIVQQNQLLPTSLSFLLMTGASLEELGAKIGLLSDTIFTELIQKIEKMVVNVQPISFILIGVGVIGMYLKLLLPMYAMLSNI